MYFLVGLLVSVGEYLVQGDSLGSELFLGVEENLVD